MAFLGTHAIFGELRTKLMALVCPVALSTAAWGGGIAESIHEYSSIRVNFHRPHSPWVMPKAVSIDLFFFSSEIPSDHRVWLRYGFERSVVNANGQVVRTLDSWNHLAISEMHQWEDYGWYVRIPKNLTFLNSRIRVSGMNFRFAVTDPDGQDVSGRFGLDGELLSRWPDFYGCQDLIATDLVTSCLMPWKQAL
jgi:hypothetical protein